MSTFVGFALVSKHSRKRAAPGARRRPFWRNPWIVGYSLALVVTGAIGIASAPDRAPAASLAQSARSKAAVLLGDAGNASHDAFHPSEAAVTQASLATGGRWYEHLALQAQAEAEERVVVDKQARVAQPSVKKPRREGRVARAVPAEPLVEPAAARFSGPSAAIDTVSLTMLAYADPSPVAGGSVRDAIAAMAAGEALPLAPGHAATVEELPSVELAALPDSVPLPSWRPKAPVVAAAKPEKPAVEVPAPAPVLAERKPAAAEGPKLAYARPDDPAESGGIGKAFKGLFGGRPSAGNGVAVYDISAATVYMPDGSTLEAHSGIGRMADNPKYVHVKMNGPTPPHTYNLRMREKRFHGVEAIRMLPVDGRNKHGRDGFLTHSYLLRGGRAESHGCVAFKNYPKFLAAFKAGKVRQLIVVAGDGRQVARKAQSGGDV